MAFAAVERISPERIATETLQTVLASCFSLPELAAIAGVTDRSLSAAAMVRDAAARSRSDVEVAARAAQALDVPGDSSVELASAHLHVALEAGDLARAGQVLWDAARTPGAAWRRFEERARLAIVVHALVRSPRVHAEPMAAK